MASQTKTPYGVLNLPSKAELLEEFLGASTDSLRTPALIIDRTVFAENCADMHQRSHVWGASFRAHLKTHKVGISELLTPFIEPKSVSDQTVEVSTLIEAWQLVNAGLVSDATVRDVLYGLPVACNKLADLFGLRNEILKQGGTLRILIDHPDQIKAIESFDRTQNSSVRWSTFVKIDGGQKRAGVENGTPQFEELLEALFASPVISVYGFYIHAGNSYASRSSSEASSFLSAEVEAVNTAAKAGLLALSRSPDSHSEVHNQPFVLSVGSTPTAHVASAETRMALSACLYGTLELHAGNYPLNDLQQLHTGLIREENIAQRVRATIISYYPGRGVGGEDEALIDAGALALSKDIGPIAGYGNVIGKKWKVGRISQEHGILTKIPENPTGDSQKEVLRVGSQVDIVGQHACLIAA
ncbi:hypothetical protein H0H93_007315, partial [Arthromyces matolae]